MGIHEELERAIAQIKGDSRLDRIYRNSLRAFQAKFPPTSGPSQEEENR